jgi:hypothetical protein
MRNGGGCWRESMTVVELANAGRGRGRDGHGACREQKLEERRTTRLGAAPADDEHGERVLWHERRRCGCGGAGGRNRYGRCTTQASKGGGLWMHTCMCLVSERVCVLGRCWPTAQVERMASRARGWNGVMPGCTAGDEVGTGVARCRESLHRVSSFDVWSSEWNARVGSALGRCRTAGTERRLHRFSAESCLQNALRTLGES